MLSLIVGGWVTGGSWMFSSGSSVGSALGVAGSAELSSESGMSSCRNCLCRT